MSLHKRLRNINKDYLKYNLYGEKECLFSPYKLSGMFFKQ